jgi:nitronate monooxygenase
MPLARHRASGDHRNARRSDILTLIAALLIQIVARYSGPVRRLVAKRHYEAILEATGDDTIRTTTPDIACQIQWPPGFTARVRRNAFTKRWHGRERELQQCVAVEAKYRQAFAEGDPDNTGVWFGEAAGLIREIESAGDIVRRIAGEAEALLTAGPKRRAIG